MFNFRWISLLREPACSFVVSGDPDCKCVRCLASHEKCARRGCENKKANDFDFCVSCFIRGKARTSTSCDNLTAVA